MTREIALMQGGVAIVDDDDYPRVAPYRWRLDGSGYPVATVNGKPAFMHRLILPVLPRFVSDHINGNRLDNRRSNLRACTQAENSVNRRRNRTNRSGFKGVSLNVEMGRWVAAIYQNGKRHGLGWFATAEEAARAYDAEARRRFGEFGTYNFPRKGERAA